MRRFLAVLVLAASVGCGGDKVTSARDVALNGRYVLKTINGVRLPYTFMDGSSTITVSTDVIDIAEFGVWTETYSYSIDGTRADNSDGGRVIINGTSITLMSVNEQAYAGTFSGSTLTLSHGSMAYVFSR